MMEEALLLLPNTILQGERLYAAAIDEVIAKAERELLIFDPDFSKGGYSSLKRYELFRNFLATGSHHQLTLVMHKADYLTGRCTRLMDLLKIYSHSFTVYITDERAHAAQDAIVLADEKHYLHRFCMDHARFKYQYNDAAGVRALHERFHQLLEISRVIGLSSVVGL